MPLRFFIAALIWLSVPLPGIGVLAAESTGSLGVSAVIANRCEIATTGAVAQVTCSLGAKVTMSLTGAETEQLPLQGAQPRLIRLPASNDGASILVIAY